MSVICVEKSVVTFLFLLLGGVFILLTGMVVIFVGTGVGIAFPESETIVIATTATLVGILGIVFGALVIVGAVMVN